MIMDIPLPLFVCGIIFLAALCTDISRQKIPNRLTIPAILSGICFHSFYGLSTSCLSISASIDGLWLSLQGVLAGGGLLFIPFLLGGMGGGDVKLLAASGAWLGPEAVVWIFFYGAVPGGLWSLLMMLKGKKLGRLKNILQDYSFFQATRRRSEPASKTDTFPYSIPMAVGFLIYLFRGSLF